MLPSSTNGVAILSDGIIYGNDVELLIEDLYIVCSLRKLDRRYPMFIGSSTHRIPVKSPPPEEVVKCIRESR